MSFWLSAAAKDLREKAERKPVHVAAGANLDQSTVWRFEHRGTFPRDVDALIAAYADDLEIDAIDIWNLALKLWRADEDKRHASA